MGIKYHITTTCDVPRCEEKTESDMASDPAALWGRLFADSEDESINAQLCPMHAQQWMRTLLSAGFTAEERFAPEPIGLVSSKDAEEEETGLESSGEENPRSP
jgi:hypothetical protein